MSAKGLPMAEGIEIGGVVVVMAGWGLGTGAGRGSDGVVARMESGVG